MNIIKTKMPIRDCEKVLTWSNLLEDLYGREAAMALSKGAEIILECIEEDIEELANSSEDAHIGELSYSYWRSFLPQQFLKKYTYEFCYCAKCHVLKILDHLEPIEFECGFDKILFYVMVKLGYASMIQEEEERQMEEYCEPKEFDMSWIYKMLQDNRILNCFSEGGYFDESSPYHFNQWTKI